jgi:hypothetical protein
MLWESHLIGGPHGTLTTLEKGPASNVGVTWFLSQSSSNRFLSECFDFFLYK